MWGISAVTTVSPLERRVIWYMSGGGPGPRQKSERRGGAGLRQVDTAPVINDGVDGLLNVVGDREQVEFLPGDVPAPERRSDPVKNAFPGSKNPPEILLGEPERLVVHEGKIGTGKGS